MAGSKLNTSAKIKASTMLEVIIAMVIIMVVFGIAMMIFTNVMQSSVSVKKIQAQAILNEDLQAIEKAKTDTAGQSITAGDFRIEQKIKSYGSNKKLLEVDLAAYDANQVKITELHKVILNNNE